MDEGTGRATEDRLMGVSPPVQTLLNRVVGTTREELGAALVGVHAIGSIALGDFEDRAALVAASTGR